MVEQLDASRRDIIIQKVENKLKSNKTDRVVFLENKNITWLQ